MVSRRTKVAVGTGVGVLLGLALIGIGVAGAAEPDARPKVPPRKGPGGKGNVFRGRRRRDGTGAPPLPPGIEEFDFEGNGVFVDADCEIVAEGQRFWPSSIPERFDLDGETSALGEACAVASYADLTGTVLKGEEPQLELSGSDAGCTAPDLIDNWIIFEGEWDPIRAAQRLLREISPLCADVDPALWGDGLFAWYNLMVDRITAYIPRKVGWLDAARPDWRDTFTGGGIVPTEDEIREEYREA